MVSRTPMTPAETADRLRDTEGIMRVVREAQVAAVRRHAAAGRKIPLWRNGRVEWVLAAECLSEMAQECVDENG